MNRNSAPFFERAARSGDTVGSSMPLVPPVSRGTPPPWRATKAASFMASSGQVVSDRNNRDSPWPLSGGATGKTTAPLAEIASPK